MTPYTDFTSITGGTLTLSAGDAGRPVEEDLCDSCIDNTNWVDVGDSIRFISDGGADDGTVPCTCSLVVRPF